MIIDRTSVGSHHLSQSDLRGEDDVVLDVAAVDATSCIRRTRKRAMGALCSPDRALQTHNNDNNETIWHAMHHNTPSEASAKQARKCRPGPTITLGGVFNSLSPLPRMHEAHVPASEMSKEPRGTQRPLRDSSRASITTQRFLRILVGHVRER